MSLDSSPSASPAHGVRRVSFSTRTPRKPTARPFHPRSPYVFSPSDSEKDESSSGTEQLDASVVDQENIPLGTTLTPCELGTPEKISIPRLDFSTRKPVNSALRPKRLFQPTPVRPLHSPDRSISPSPAIASRLCDELAEVDLALDFGALGLADDVQIPSPTRAEIPHDVSSEEESDAPVLRHRPRRARKVILSDDEDIPDAGPSRPKRVIVSSEESDSEILPTSRGTTSISAKDIIDLSVDSENDSEGSGYDSMQDFIVDDSDISDDSHILSYSPPRKPYILPSFQDLSLSDSDDSPLPQRKPLHTPRQKKAWTMEREQIAQELFDELDRKVFEGKLAGTTIEWSKRLLTTAGTASLTKTRKPDGTSTKIPKITLSIKVLSEEDQIINTVAHEMCHLATWLISDEHKNPHGKVFKSWGRKIMRKRTDITVTTKHDYEIVFKFEWQCSNKECGKIYRRHSKSIDTMKHACGSCRGKLEPLFATKASTPFQVYLKENMAHAKAALPRASHGDVMRALSKRWTEGGTDHEAYWKSLRIT